MADQMTTEQIHEFRAAFNIFDKDGSGTIAIDELTEVLQSVGQATGRGEIEAMLEAADVDNSGEVDFPEFLTLVSEKMAQNGPDVDLPEIFRYYDINRTGFITASNLQFAMGKLGLRLTPEEADEMIREADVDGDGLMNYQEFCKMMVVN